MSWNVDGSLLATGSYDKSVILFAYKDGKLFRDYSLKEHNHSIDQLAWHPIKPDILLTYSADRVVRLWNVKQRKALQSYSIKADALCVAWAPDGKTFAVGDKDDVLTFYEVEKGQKVDRQFGYEINEFVFRESNGSIYLFLTTGTTAGHGGRLEYFEYAFPELRPINSIPVSGVTSTVAKLNYTGSALAVGGMDGNVTLWDMNGMFPMQEVSRQKQGIRGISFSHDNRFIACVAEHENYIDVALVETGEKVWSFQNEERDDEEHTSLCCIAFHPTQLYLACAYDHKKSHKDGSFVRLFGGTGPYDDKKKDGRDSRGRSRERETKAVKKPLPVKVEKDKDGKDKEKVRFESKFSFLKPTAEQLAGLEERKAAKEARDAKAAQMAQARAAAAAARLPVKVATRLGAAVTASPVRSGIRETAKPQLPAQPSRDSPKNSRPASPRNKDVSSGRREDDPKEGSSRSSSTNTRKLEVEENDRKRIRSSAREGDGKDSKQQPAAPRGDNPRR
ncbi:hypothetical protein RvY_05837 [Ramazzottius varieornatus]|uniref:Anaphase-promoting complex subunit 4-like WD40 domain-containing protein n=1 Tax=Ramazzottius varieornatus TaxID=947166 RepID=A0A1D1V642_RAMVA|nr:hypothetical protein RvY_05837 [Ramazzottius varieornatus]